jgi:hypothetical protein
MRPGRSVRWAAWSVPVVAVGAVVLAGCSSGDASSSPSVGAVPQSPSSTASSSTTSSSTASGSTASAEPVLGATWGSNQKGLAEATPTGVDFGGDATGVVTGITWADWGQPTATGQGTAVYVAPDQANADGTEQPATVVATGLGTCKGVPAYTQLWWFFPGKGGAGSAHFDACTGADTHTGLGATSAPSTG